MIAFLPRNLANAAKFCADADTRFVMSSVVLNLYADSYRVQATDGRVACVIRGQVGPPRKDLALPIISALDGVQCTTFEAQIPSDEWLRLFECGKKVAKGEERSPSIGLTLQEGVVHAAAGRDMRRVVLPFNPGRFPAIPQVVPAEKPALTFDVDLNYLKELVDLAMSFGDADADGHRKATMIFWGEGRPIALSRKSPTQSIEILFMPLTGDSKVKIQGLAEYKDKALGLGPLFFKKPVRVEELAAKLEALTVAGA